MLAFFRYARHHNDLKQIVLYLGFLTVKELWLLSDL